MAESLTVVGASVRAAVCSAVRAGFACFAGDMFADLDLTRVATAEGVPDYPQGLARTCAGPQPGGWMYTGGLENHPDLVERFASMRPLWGNPAGVLRRVRQPELVAQVLRAAGLTCPEIWQGVQPPPFAGDWLRKPLRSTGGLRIARWQSTPTAGLADANWYLQRFIPGLPCAAVYLAAAGQALLLGVSEQLIGTPWLASGGFRYSGSIGPLDLPTGVREQFVAVGQALAVGFDLIGLFGVDAILADEVVWPLEVNPRYTASVEVLEQGYDWQTIGAHVETCQSASLRPAAEMISKDRPIRQVCGKAVLFARQPLVITEAQSRSWLESAAGSSKDEAGSTAPASHWPTHADVPTAGTNVPTGGPIVTLLAAGENGPQVRRQLQAMAAAEEGGLYSKSAQGRP